MNDTLEPWNVIDELLTTQSITLHRRSSIAAGHTRGSTRSGKVNLHRATLAV